MKRLTVSKRQWSLWFHLATCRRSAGFDELCKLFAGRWSPKTIRRDLDLLSHFGVTRVNNDGIWYYRYTGPTHPFFSRPGQKWCASCRDFLPLDRFGLQRSSPDGLAHQCLKCKGEISKRYFWKNRAFHLKRQKRYYKSKVKRELVAEGLILVRSKTN